MDSSRNSPVPSTAKDVLLNKIDRCNQRLPLLQGLRDNVSNAVDEACLALGELIAKIERAAVTDDRAQLQFLSREIRTISNLITKYESALDGVIEVSETADIDLEHLTASNVDFDRVTTPGLSSTGPPSEKGASPGLAQSLTLPLVPSVSSFTSATANFETELIQTPDSDQRSISPEEFNTAESCSSSSTNDTRPTCILSPVGNIPVATVNPLSAEPILRNNSNTSSPLPSIQPIKILPGRIGATVANSLATQSVSPIAKVTKTQPIFQGLRITPIGSSSEGTESSSSSSHSDNLTSSTASNSSTSAVRDNRSSFIEGESIPSGRFYFEEDKKVRFYVRHVVSPDEFYVQSLSYEASAKFTQVSRDLNRFYNMEENQKQLFRDGDSEQADDKIDMYGVYRYRDMHSADSEIRRCVIIGWKESATDKKEKMKGMQRFEAHIRFIDVGGISTKWVRATDIWKIDKRFCKMPALTIKCRLFDTRPRDEGSSTAFGHWPEEAISKFKSLCDGDRPMNGYVMNKQEPYRLLIYVCRDSAKICINAELVLAKLAKALTNWSRAAQISVTNPDNRIEKAEAASVNLKVDFLCFDADIPLMNPPLRGTTVYVDVQKFFSCCRFSVNFPQGTIAADIIDRDPYQKALSIEPIQKFSDAVGRMNEFYSSRKGQEFPTWPLVGQLVAAKYRADDRYYRARLLDIIPEDNNAHVRFVDYGNDEWVPVDSLRPLRKEFLSMPYMAMECVLAGLRPLPRATLLTENINVLTQRINGALLLAQVVDIVMRPPPAGPVLEVILTSSVDRNLNINNYVVSQKWAERE